MSQFTNTLVVAQTSTSRRNTKQRVVAVDIVKVSVHVELLHIDSKDLTVVENQTGTSNLHCHIITLSTESLLRVNEDIKTVDYVTHLYVW